MIHHRNKEPGEKCYWSERQPLNHSLIDLGNISENWEWNYSQGPIREWYINKGNGKDTIQVCYSCLFFLDLMFFSFLFQPLVSFLETCLSLRPCIVFSDGQGTVVSTTIFGFAWLPGFVNHLWLGLGSSELRGTSSAVQKLYVPCWG